MPEWLRPPIAAVIILLVFIASPVLYPLIYLHEKDKERRRKLGLDR